MDNRSHRAMPVDVAAATVRLQALASNGSVLAWGSGFLVAEYDFLSLYTCWHFVSGIDPRNVPPHPTFPRKKLKVQSAAIGRQQPGAELIGGLYEFEIELYDHNDRPTWHQKSDPKTSDARIPIPPTDCVRFNVEKQRSYFAGWFDPNDELFANVSVGTDVFIVGYPFGFSSNVVGPHPIFLRRTRASDWAPDGGPICLLDGAGQEGMSGGPVVIKYDGQWKLAGVYTGAIFPEAQNFLTRLLKQNNRSELPLGTYILSMIARKAAGTRIVYPDVMPGGLRRIT